MCPEPIPLRDKLYGNLEGAEEDSCLREGGRPLRLVYDEEEVV